MRVTPTTTPTVYIPPRFRDLTIPSSILVSYTSALFRRTRLCWSFEFELVFFAIFLALVIIQRVSPEPGMYAQSLVIHQTFPTRPNSTIMSTFLQFTNGPDEYFQYLNNVLYSTVFLQGNSTRFGANPNAPLLLFPPLIQLLRVNSGPCPSLATHLNQTCYPDIFSASDISTQPYLNTSFDSQGNGEPYYHGVLATYPPTGYYFPLPLDRNQTATLLSTLFQSNLIDPATRFVSLSLSMYFANLGVLCHVRPVVEITSSGLWLSSYTDNCAPMFPNPDNNVFALQIALAVAESLFAIGTVASALKFGFSWFILFMDVCAIGIFIAQSILAFTWNTSSPITINGHSFISGQPQATYASLQALYATSSLFFAWRFFLYSELFPYTSTSRATIFAAAWDIFHFFVSLLFIACFYGLCAVTMLGSTRIQWATSISVVQTILSYVYGEIPYFSLWTFEPFGQYFAPMFVVSWLFVFLWFLPTVLVAILYQSWKATVAERRARAPRLLLSGSLVLEHVRLACGLPAKPGYLSEYSVCERVRALPSGPVSFVQLRQALHDEPDQVLAGHTDEDADEDPRSEQTGRLMAAVAELCSVSEIERPSPTMLRRLTAALNRLQAHATVVTQTLVRQLSSVAEMMKKKKR